MTRRTLVMASAALAVLGFVLVTFFYTRNVEEQASATLSVQDDVFVRPHSLVLGPDDAPVTIVEFFDPACETCRAFHPIVMRYRTNFPETVRVVLRYAPLHKGSSEAVRILETARLQGVFEPVLVGLFNAQPIWAAHGAPNLRKAWEVAGAAGLDVELARREMLSPDITATLNQDMADGDELGVRQTPSFFVNGKPLVSFGERQLSKLVHDEVAAATELSDK